MSPTIVTLGAIPELLSSTLSSRFRLLPIDAQNNDPSLEVAVTTSMVGADRQQMDRLPGLRLILCNGAGLDRIDLEEARQRGIEIFNTPDAVTEDTADLAIALLYAAKRRVIQNDRFVREGDWGRTPLTPSRRISATKIGIVGLGKIGALVARRIAALGAEVAYHTRSAKSECPYPYFAELHALAHWCDVMILCCPATPATEGMIDLKVLQLLGPEGMLINIARGSVVVEADLLEALESGALGFAGLDVFASEPDIHPHFRTLPNVILSPHAAAVTYETRRDIAQMLLGRADLHYTQPLEMQPDVR